MDSLVRMHQTVWRWDSGALHDCKEEVQKLPVYQLQRQKGDQSMQCSPLLAGYKGLGLHSGFQSHQWLDCWFGLLV